MKEQFTLDEIKKIMNLDPIDIAEKTLGEKSESSIWAGMAINQIKHKTLQEALKGHDTYWGCSFNEVETVLKSIGLVQEYEEIFGKNQDIFRIYIHENKTMFSTLESFSFNNNSIKKINTINLYMAVNIKDLTNHEISDLFRDTNCSRDAIEYREKDGSFKRSDYVLCNFDGRIGLVSYSAHLFNHVMTTPLTREPFLWLLNYEEPKQEGYDHYEISMRKLKQCKSYKRIVGWEV